MNIGKLFRKSEAVSSLYKPKSIIVVRLLTGFTLVEAIVSIFIIGLISAITVASYGDLRNSSALNRTVQKIALDVRRAQNLAATASTQFGGSVSCGYGIHYLDSDTYFLFTDDCVSANKTFDEGEAVETINIEQPNMKFKNSFSDILFFPPDPVTYINGFFDHSLKSIITLCVEDKCKLINIWGNGRIDIE